MNRAEYRKRVCEREKTSPCLKNALRAFWVGGSICLLGQLLGILFETIGLSGELCASCVSLSLIFLSGLLTGIGVFDRIAKYAGAGTLVPITGFANAITSEAVDARTEGYVTGVASKMFVIAGPVLVYGTVSSVLYGVIRFLLYGRG